MSVRAMLEADAEKAFLIESGVTQFPWSAQQYRNSIIADDAFVLEQAEEIVGFIIFKRVLDETNLLNIVVDSQHQGQGFGRYLLEFGLAHQLTQGAKNCFLEVRKSNVAAQQLYQALGFMIIGIRKNYYPLLEGKEDAVVMSAEILNKRVEKMYDGVIDESC
jgi:ribosomal-protein-alanine N-acetyltransferase